MQNRKRVRKITLMRLRVHGFVFVNYINVINLVLFKGFIVTNCLLEVDRLL